MDRKPCQTTIVESDSEEVSSIEWDCDMTEDEEDLIIRMYRLVGGRWSLIAGRLPGRKAEEVERYWIMRTQQQCDCTYSNKKQPTSYVPKPSRGWNRLAVNS